MLNIRARAITSSTTGSGKHHDDFYNIAFAELVAYVEDIRTETSIAPVFKLSDLAQMYKTRLEQLGVEVDGRVHTSRLKLRLLSVIPNLRATSQGRNVMLSFDDDISGALQKACEYDYNNDHDAMHLVRAAKVVRREKFKQKYLFDGSFTEESLRNVVPQSLLARNLIDTFFSLGICVSYDRLLRLTSDISNGVCDKFTINGIVCPPKLRSKLFTTAAVDNIDYNPSSATAKSSFHGTGI